LLWAGGARAAAALQVQDHSVDANWGNVFLFGFLWFQRDRCAGQQVRDDNPPSAESYVPAMTWMLMIAPITTKNMHLPIVVTSAFRTLAVHDTRWARGVSKWSVGFSGAKEMGSWIDGRLCLWDC
jgi:hypothetical protein